MEDKDFDLALLLVTQLNFLIYQREKIILCFVRVK